MANVEKPKDLRPKGQVASNEEPSELYRQFQQLKPAHASKGEAVLAAVRDLECLAAEHGQTDKVLLLEAHSTSNSKPHHIQAMKLERLISNLRR